MTPMPPEMEALKARLKTTWMAGDYGHFATYVEPGALEYLAHLAVAPGTRMLDVACGAGQLAIPAARAGPLHELWLRTNYRGKAHVVPNSDAGLFLGYRVNRVGIVPSRKLRRSMRRRLRLAAERGYETSQADFRYTLPAEKHEILVKHGRTLPV